MRQIANMILEILKEKLPVVFEDIGNEKFIESEKATDDKKS